MRIRLDPISSNFVDEVARAEGRTRPDAARVLIAEAVRQRHGRPPHVPASDIEGGAIRGRTVACHVKNHIAAAIEEFARREERSTSAALRILLRDALRWRGLMPTPVPGPINTIDAAR